MLPADVERMMMELKQAQQKVAAMEAEREVMTPRSGADLQQEIEQLKQELENEKRRTRRARLATRARSDSSGSDARQVEALRTQVAIASVERARALKLRSHGSTHSSGNSSPASQSAGSGFHFPLTDRDRDFLALKHRMEEQDDKIKRLREQVAAAPKSSACVML